jgi:hypothetical protein
MLYLQFSIRLKGKLLNEGQAGTSVNATFTSRKVLFFGTSSSKRCEQQVAGSTDAV